MNDQEKINEMKADYTNISIPEKGVAQMEVAISKAKSDRRKSMTLKRWRNALIATAAALTLVVIAPNANRQIAMAMEKVPVIGSFVKVITFGRYEVEKDNYHAQIQVPQILPESPVQAEAVEAINLSIQSYSQLLIDQFQKDLEANKGDFKSIDMDYEVVTDTPQWFTLKINVVETQASGYQYARFYHINKSTNEIVELKDLFLDNSDYVKVVSEEIIKQMRERMKADESQIYFIDSIDMPELDFKTIKEDQNFYFDVNHDLVIVFDEYEAAPGSMGCPEFTLSAESLSKLLKPDLLDN